MQQMRRLDIGHQLIRDLRFQQVCLMPYDRTRVLYGIPGNPMYFNSLLNQEADAGVTNESGSPCHQNPSHDCITWSDSVA